MRPISASAWTHWFHHTTCRFLYAMSTIRKKKNIVSDVEDCFSEMRKKLLFNFNLQLSIASNSGSRLFETHCRTFRNCYSSISRVGTGIGNRYPSKPTSSTIGCLFFTFNLHLHFEWSQQNYIHATQYEYAIAKVTTVINERQHWRIVSQAHFMFTIPICRARLTQYVCLAKCSVTTLCLSRMSPHDAAVSVTEMTMYCLRFV